MTRLRRRAVVAAVVTSGLVLQVPIGPARGAVAATIKLRPDLGPPTLPFGVQGQGYGASEVVDITFDLALIGTATTTPTGSFKKRVAVPATATPGTHTVTATGEDSGLTASTSFLVRTNWPRFHFDSANTGFNPFENVLSVANVGTLVQKWAVPTGGTAAPDPIVAYGRVYVAPTDGVVRALDPSNGALLWSFASGGTMSGTAPTAANNLIYVGNDTGVVFALNASTGVPVWSHDLGNFVYGSPVVATGAVYVQADTLVYSLNPSTGATQWTGGAYVGYASPTAAFGLVFNEAAFGCNVEALNAATGASIWDDTFCSEGFSSLTVAASGGRVFDVSVGVKGLDAQTGGVDWDTSIFLGSTLLPAAVANGHAYVSNAGLTGFLTSLDENTGAIEWQVAIADPSNSSPAVANGVIYLGGDGGFLRAYDASNGALLWTSPAASTAVDATAAISDGRVYSATADGTVRAFGLP